MHRFLTLILFSLMVPSGGAAQSTGQVPGDLSKLDIATLQQRAAGGDVGAEQQLGWDYAHGLGVARDYAQAAAWFRKAADHGASFSQNELGFLYQKGEGVPKDNAQAVNWYRKAAEQGRATAQENLGYLYQKGIGVPQDDAQALLWYRKAAEQGYDKGEESLGSMYENGWGVDKDPVAARVWYEKAAAQGDQSAQSALSRLDAAAAADRVPPAPPEKVDGEPEKAAPAPVSVRSRVLSKAELVLLLKDLEPRRVAILVRRRGVNFSLNPAAERDLRAAGADDQLLLAIATNRRQ